MAAGFLPPALTEITTVLFIYILLRVRICIFLAHAAHPQLLASSGSPQPGSPPRGGDLPPDGWHRPRTAPAEGSGPFPALPARGQPAQPGPPEGSPQPGPPRPGGPPAGSRPSPAGVGPGRRCRRGAPAAVAGGGGGGCCRPVPHITPPLGSAPSSLLSRGRLGTALTLRGSLAMARRLGPAS